MYDIFRDSALGYCLRRLSHGRVGKYPEELPTFELPREYAIDMVVSPPHLPELFQDTRYTRGENRVDDGGRPEDETSVQRPTSNDRPPSLTNEEKITLVGWYSDTDPDNPHQWSKLKKGYISVLLLLYTFTMYIGSSLYTASIPDIIRIFSVSRTVASLGLSVFILGYGIGPLVLSPLSEIPSIGRNAPYITTFVLFFVLCIPTALVNNVPGLYVLRFLLGFLGSPALATCGASYGDFYGAQAMPYVLTLWGGGATLGPALGPLIGGFAVENRSWRWTSWELLWLTGLSVFLMFISLPETSSDNILLRRARRLRQLSGRTDIKAPSEIKEADYSARSIAISALFKPWEINALDPAVLFTTAYTALIYGIYYSFFESFPLVYGGMYGFDLGEIGLAFLGVACGLVVAMAVYCSYFYFFADPRFARMESVPPEARLWPGLVATFFIPVGLLIFAWTTHPTIPWAVSLLGVAMSMIGVFTITQCMFVYLPFTYPQYSGSLFAANGFARSAFAAGAVLFAGPMFARLGVDGGVSLLAGLTVLCIFGIYFIYFFGARMRAKSKFAVS